MVQISSVLVFVSLVSGLVSAAPLRARQCDVDTTDDATAAVAAASTGAFALLDYADFQISSGVGGDAEAEANAIFADKFAGIDLATVSDATNDDIETMRQAAEAAESDFNDAIDAATGDAADALQVGKIKNKVLKLSAEVLNLTIKQAVAAAAGDDTSDIDAKITVEQTKLSNNIKTDVASAGAASTPVV